MVMVPAIVLEVRPSGATRSSPTWRITSTRPYPFSPLVVVDIEPVLDQVVDALDCHVSQFYEWLAYNGFCREPPLSDPAERRPPRPRFPERIAPLADEHRGLLVKTYGPERGQGNPLHRGLRAVRARPSSPRRMRRRSSRSSGGRGYGSSGASWKVAARHGPRPTTAIAFVARH